MNQNMHSWIATLLGVVTVRFIIQWRRFNEKESNWLQFIIDMVVIVICFGIWLCKIS